MSSSSSSSQSSSSSSASAGNRGIFLRRWAQTRFVDGAVDGFRLRVTAYGASNMPNEIFRYLVRPVDPSTGEEAASFDGVCSAPDLEDIPATEPLPNVVPPFFRLAVIDMVVPSNHVADDAWAIIKQEVEILVETLNLMDVLEVIEDVKFGDPPPAVPPALE